MKSQHTLDLHCHDQGKNVLFYGIDKLYSFDGQLKFINCNPGYKDAVLWHAADDMDDYWDLTPSSSTIVKNELY